MTNGDQTQMVRKLKSPNYEEKNLNKLNSDKNKKQI